jgi:hypothetical protein
MSTSGDVEPERKTLSVTRERARRYRVAVSTGLILSVLFHILVVRLSPLIIGYMEPVGFPQPPIVTVQPEGMRVIDYQITETPQVEPEPVPEPEPEPEEPAPEVATSVTEPRLTAAERLRPRIGDWRLWLVTPIVRHRPDLTPEQRAEEVRQRLYAMLEAYDDSVAAEIIRQAEAMDWTVGEEGNKWGVSPGRIHLGPITLPLPFYVGPGRESEDMLRDYDAIQRQAGQAEIDETFDDRRKAIREREERAREAAKRDTTKTR